LAFSLSSKKISKEQQLTDMYQAEVDELLDMSLVNIECPCGKNKFEASLFASIENVFDCSVCGNKFKADITITPTLLTEPVNSINKTFDELLQQKER